LVVVNIAKNAQVLEQHNSQGGTWQLDAKVFEAAKVDLASPRVENSNNPSKLRKYYEQQNAMIDTFVSMQRKSGDEEGEKDETGHVYYALMISFAVNVLLTGIKLFAVIVTGSMAVVASFLDSCLDLVAGLIMYWTAIKIAKVNTFKYPQGKARLEPIGTVVFASVMGFASLQILSECVKRLASGLNDTPADLEMGVVPIVILGSTIVFKAILYYYCNWVAENYQSVSVEAYAQDHFNDVIANVVATAGAILASKVCAPDQLEKLKSKRERHWRAL